MKTYKIIQELNDTDPPKEHEKEAAKILAEYFRSDLLFMRKKANTTPDLKNLSTGQRWEIKSPLGNGKRTIANNLREASHQSENVVLDLSRCKINNQSALSRVRGFLSSGDAHIKRLLVIDKSKKVIDFSNSKR